MAFSRVLGALALVALLSAPAASSRGLSDSSHTIGEEGSIWAVLVAGSNGWGNYRHQADIAHAYQLLVQGGVSADKIIALAYDDVARHPFNPHPGKLFNRPGGPDVYGGLKLDYTGQAVNAETFLAVLAGNASALPAPSTASPNSGRVLGASAQDHVFVYYADHGAPGIVGMPSGRFLYADELVRTLQARADAGGHASLVFYLEACESGSMFSGLLQPGSRVFATTAANGEESSWGTYCPGEDPAPPPELTTCLGDLYSVAWMEDTEVNDPLVETLKRQFANVQARTSNNYTYQMGSHVQRFGNFAFDEHDVGEFLGDDADGERRRAAARAIPRGGPASPLDPATPLWRRFIDATLALVGRPAWVGSARLVGPSPHPLATRDGELSTHVSLPQREADLAPLRARARAGDAEAPRELETELARRGDVDAAATEAVRAALGLALARGDGREPRTRARHDGLLGLAAPRPSPLEALAAGIGAPRGDGLGAARRPVVTAELVQLVSFGELPGRRGLALVDDWDCLRGAVGVWEDACGPLDQYSMRWSRAFANLCNARVGLDTLEEAARGACAVPHGGARAAAR